MSAISSFIHFPNYLFVDLSRLSRFAELNAAKLIKKGSLLIFYQQTVNFLMLRTIVYLTDCHISKILPEMAEAQPGICYNQAFFYTTHCLTGKPF